MVSCCSEQSRFNRQAKRTRDIITFGQPDQSFDIEDSWDNDFLNPITSVDIYIPGIAVLQKLVWSRWVIVVSAFHQ